MDLLLPGERPGALDIAVARVWLRRLDAEGDKMARIRCATSARHRIAKRRAVTDHVIGRQHEEDAVRIALLHVERRRRHRRGGIASGGLEQLCRRPHTQFLELLCHHEAMVAIADDDRWRAIAHALYARHRVLEEAARSGKGEKLLRPRLARERPEPRAAAAAQDDRMNSPRHPPILWA